MLLQPPVVGTSLLDWLWPKHAFGKQNQKHASTRARSRSLQTQQQINKRAEEKKIETDVLERLYLVARSGEEEVDIIDESTVVAIHHFVELVANRWIDNDREEGVES
jgi:hypothetical protein